MPLRTATLMLGALLAGVGLAFPLFSRLREPAPVASPAPASQSANRTTQGRTGPWGELWITRVSIEQPEEYILLPEDPPAPPQWIFQKRSRAQVMELLKEAGLTPAQLAAFATVPWGETGQETIVEPTPEMALALSPAARGRIYSLLAEDPRNVPQNLVFVYRPALLEERLAGSRLPASEVARLRQLFYPQEEVLLFADYDLFLASLSSRRQRLDFVRTATRKNTLLLTLRIQPDTRIGPLLDYWASAKRLKDLRPLLESLARTPNGHALDVVHLLPPLPRKLCYTYPEPSDDPVVANRDCHWTALNFFQDPPDDQLTVESNVVARLQARYHLASDTPRFGDLICLRDRQGEIIHSSVYIAADVVFTKNGPAYFQPWIFMTIEDMKDVFEGLYVRNGPISIVVYRHTGS